MKGTCGILGGVLILIAGVALLLFGIKSSLVDVSTAHIVAGAALGLFGIAKLAHMKGVCPACK